MDIMDQVLAQAAESIDRRGWMVTHVSGICPVHGPEGQGFTYTAGCWQKDHPEFVISGLPYEIAHMVLNDLAGRVMDGQRFTPDQVLDDLVEDLPAMLVDAPNAEISIARALAFDSVEALQIVWTSPTGKWPWEDVIVQTIQDCFWSGDRSW